MKNFSVIIIYCILALATLLVYYQVGNFDFVNYDDPGYVAENPHVYNGLNVDSIIWAFRAGHAANWHPLTWLSLMLDCQLFGVNPGAMHLTNLILHILNTLLLFAVLKKMTGSLWPSAFVAIVFAIHPMHVESVAWITERKDVLSTFFLLVTLISYVNFVRQKGLFRYLVALILFSMGLLAKPMLVTLPFLLVLLDYWPLNRLDSAKIFFKLIIEKIPFFILAAVICTVTLLVQQSSMIDINKFAFQSRVANVFLSYIRYIYKLFWFENLSVIYPLDARQIQFWHVIICALLLIVISFLVIYFRRKHRYLPVGWFWYIGTLVPVIGLVQVGFQSYADRYSYIPYIGLLIIIGWGMVEIISKLPNLKTIINISAVIILIIMEILSFGQTAYWKNSCSLFTHAIEVTKNNAIAHYNLGVAYSRMGYYVEAIETYQQAIKIQSKYFDAYNNLGYAYIFLNRHQEASDAFNQAIKINPKYARAHFNLGLIYLLEGKKDLALEECKILKTLNIELSNKLVSFSDNNCPDIKFVQEDTKL